jgi:hypothetical protein
LDYDFRLFVMDKKMKPEHAMPAMRVEITKDGMTPAVGSMAPGPNRVLTAVLTKKLAIGNSLPIKMKKGV